MKPRKYENAWIVPDEHTDEYGVLVRCGTKENSYWWLLCPANATLSTGPNFDVSGCSDGAGCMWEEIHAKAENLRRYLSLPESTQRVLQWKCPTCNAKSGQMCQWTKKTTPAVDIESANRDGAYHETRYCASIGDARGAMG